MFEGKRVLITGGAGFIGSNLAIRLAQDSANVTIIDSLVPSYGGNLFNIQPVEERIRVNISDVRDSFSFERLVADQDILFNLAGQTSHMDSMADPITDLQINCQAQLSILETCRRINPGIKIVFASTRQIYGRPEYLPVDERHPIRPVDVNGVNKLAGESYHILYNNVYGIRACALRLTNTIGPRMRIVDDRQTFAGVWIRNLLQGKPIEVWGGKQLRDFNDVEDVVNALLLCATSEQAWGKVFNLGAASVISLEELAKLMITIHGGGTLTISSYPEERSKIDIGDYYGSFAAIQSALGWKPEVDLASCISRTLEFFKTHSHHYIK